MAQLLASLTRGYTGERSIPNKVLMVIRDATRDLAVTEARSVQRMEGFKDQENTAANYRNGVACRDDLLAAQEALEEGELEEALVFLTRVADPTTGQAPEEPAPRKAKPRKKVRK